MSHARHINRRCRTPSVLLESVKSVSSLVEFGPPSSLLASCASVQTQTPPGLQPNPSQSNHFRQPAAIPAQNRRFAAPRHCVESFFTPTQSKTPFSTPFTPLFATVQSSRIKANQGESRQIKANQGKSSLFSRAPSSPAIKKSHWTTRRLNLFPSSRKNPVPVLTSGHPCRTLSFLWQSSPRQMI